MIEKVVKRDGRVKKFDSNRITNAVNKAYLEVYGSENLEFNALITNNVENDIFKLEKKSIKIEKIQDLIIKELKKADKKVALAYAEFRKQREKERNLKHYQDLQAKILDYISTLNDNANVDENSFSGREQRLLEYIEKELGLAQLPEKIADLHRKHVLYQHDLSKFVLGMHNCLFPNIEKLLKNGFKTRQGDVKPVKHYYSLAQVICVIIQLQSLEQFGGCGVMNFDYLAEDFVKHTFGDICRTIVDILDLGVELPKKMSLSEGRELLPLNLYNKALKMLKEDMHQADQALITNLVTLQSRSGGQLPFSSINLGSNTSDEGRLITEIFLEELDNGIGRYDRTAIFPITCYQIKKGVNWYPSDPNYDIRLKALGVAHRRLYPTFVNCEWSENKETSLESRMNLMGCVDGQEIITYKFKNKLHVESFERMWSRLSKDFEIKEQHVKQNYYMDLSDISIYDTNNGFVNTLRIIKNQDKGDWCRIKFSNGRTLLTTEDHPLPIIDKGRTYVKDLKIGDRVNISSKQYNEESIKYNEDKAWLLGVLLCDSSYVSYIRTSIALESENDLEARHKKVFSELYNLKVETIVQNRGVKGKYKDLLIKGDLKELRTELKTLFGGLQKNNRQIPNEVFSWNREAKLSFLAGMIDADGYINSTTHGGSVVQLGSVNKELSLQTMALAQSLGLPSKVYINYYNKKDKNKIRYRIEFPTTIELLQYITCQKKVNHFTKEPNKYFNSISEVSSIEMLGYMNKFSYDVTTESDCFEVSGMHSHNCRTLIGHNFYDGTYNKTGRGNLAPVTINLAYLGLKHRKDINGLFKELNEILVLAKDSLLIRYNIMKKQPLSVAPFMYDNGTIQGAEDCKDTVEEALKNSTLTIGYIGLAECLRAITGYYHNENDESQELGLKIVRTIREFCNKCKQDFKLNFATYATPAESLCMKTLQSLKDEFGIIEGITDKEYITNSHHVPVHCGENVFKKIDTEAPYSELANGGNIFHIETNGRQFNEEAMNSALQYALDKNISYIRFSHQISTCLDCGYNISASMDTCERCSSTNIENLAIVTGYLTVDIKNMNKAKQDEVKHRKENM